MTTQEPALLSESQEKALLRLHHERDLSAVGYGYLVPHLLAQLSAERSTSAALRAERDALKLTLEEDSNNPLILGLKDRTALALQVVEQRKLLAECGTERDTLRKELEEAKESLAIERDHRETAVESTRRVESRCAELERERGAEDKVCLRGECQNRLAKAEAERAIAEKMFGEVTAELNRVRNTREVRAEKAEAAVAELRGALRSADCTNLECHGDNLSPRCGVHGALSSTTLGANWKSPEEYAALLAVATEFEGAGLSVLKMWDAVELRDRDTNGIKMLRAALAQFVAFKKERT